MSTRKEVMARNDEKQVDVESLLEAQSHLWNLTFGFINSMSLKCAIQLGIPDAIHQHGQPITLSQLIASLHLPIAKTDWLRRLLRLLVHSGLLAKTNNTNSSAANDQQDGDEDYLYHLTPTSSILVKEKFNNVSPFVLMMLDSALVSPWHALSDAFKRNEIEPFKVAHTTGFWDTPEDLNKAFNQAMASDAKFLMDIVVSNWGDDVFRGLKSIVDVGGGIGAAAFIIAKRFPHIKCTVLDLPQVAASTSKSEISMVEFVGGDMFEFIPPADAVLLKWILHDWDNKDCVRILKRCKEAIPSKEKGGRVIILDMVVNEEKQDHKHLETQLFFDMLMMVLVKGKERNKQEWQKIFFDAGFSDFKIKPILGVRSIIEVYP